MVFPPATQFWCGFSIESGVTLIIFCHLLLDVSLMALVLGAVNFDFPTELPTQFGGCGQLVVLGFVLASLPFIFIGAVGVRLRKETFIRVYLFFLTLTTLCDLTLVGAELLSGNCSMFSIGVRGSAAACGSKRGVAVFRSLAVLALQSYVLHVVSSYAQEVSTSNPEQTFWLFQQAISKNSGGRPKYVSLESYGSLGGNSAEDGYGALYDSMLDGLGCSVPL